jgi:hypothetical protein
MLHAGLDLSRKKLDVCLLSDQGEHLDQLAVPPHVDSLRRLARRSRVFKHAAPTPRPSQHPHSTRLTATPKASLPLSSANAPPAAHSCIR